MDKELVLHLENVVVTSPNGNTINLAEFTLFLDAVIGFTKGK
ncbi:hypothetical protein AAFN87_11845 [Solibacillus sp. CAU 1738]